MISQLRGLTDHSICWWIRRHTAADRTDTTLSESFHFHPVPTFEIFPLLAFLPCTSLITNARLLHKPAFAAFQNWVFSLSQKAENRSEGGGAGRWWEVCVRVCGGFITFNTICIIVCIACSVSTQCQHGWSVLISKLHHKDKRNTCRYKVISLPTAHVKLFKRTRQARSYCSCMNGQMIASWFHEAKSLILIEVGSLLL